MTKDELLTTLTLLLVGIITICFTLYMNQPSISIKSIDDNGTIWVEFKNLDSLVMGNNTYFLYINDNGTELYIKDIKGNTIGRGKP